MQRLTAIITQPISRGAFRLRIAFRASSFHLHGYVKNHTGGAVKIVAEGDELDLERFIDALAVEDTDIIVSAIERQYSPATGEFEIFDIIWDERDDELYAVAELLVKAFSRPGASEKLRR